MTIDVRQYLSIEASLQNRLMKAWRPVARKLYKDMYALVKQEKFDDALKLAGTIDLGPIAQKNREYIKAVLWNAAQFGASVAANDETTAVSVGQYTKTLNRVADLFITSFVKNATLQTYRSAVQSIAQAQATAQTIQKADAPPRFLKDFVSFQDDGDEMIQVVSSLHTSRLATWGFTAECEVRGITKYKLSAVLDGRTSAYCRFINGKEFDVADARTRIVSALSVTNPDDLKTVAPWPNQNKASMASYESMSASDLSKLGYNVPPFHPGCRTICVPVGYSEEIVGTVPDTGDAQHNRATMDSFTELGVKVTQKQIDYWNQIFDIYPGDVLARLTDRTLQQVLDAKAGSAIKIATNGDVSFKGRKIIGDGTADTSVIFDPLRGQTFVNYEEFNAITAEEAAGYVRNLYRSAVDIARTTGSKQLITIADGTLGAYTHAKMGFVPSDQEWNNLSAEIQDDMADLGLTAIQEKIVTAILQSTDPHAIWVLAELHAKVKGVSLGELLLKDKKFKATLNFDDKAAMERLSWYL